MKMVNRNNPKTGFFRNFSVLVICNLLVNVINLFTNMYLARLLKPELYGQYGVLITWSGLIQMITSLGVQQVAIRAIAQNQDNSKYYFMISMIARLIGFVSFLPLFILYFVFHEHYDIYFVVAIALNALMLFIWNGFQNLAFGMQRMEYTGYINVGGALALFLVYLFIPSCMITVMLVVFLLIIIELLKDVVYCCCCRNEKLFTQIDNLPITKDAVIKMIKDSSPFFILIVFSLSTNHLPVLFLAHHTNTTEVAFFNTANKLIIPLTMALNTLMSALFPSLTKLAKSAPNKFYNQSQLALSSIVIVGGYVCFCISLFSNNIVLLLYGRDYVETGIVLLTQCWYAVLFAILSFWGTIYAAVGKDRLLAILSIVNALVWGPIIWWCSKGGATLMSYGFLVGGIINLSYNYIFYKQSLPMKIPFSSIIKLIVFFIIGLSFSLILPNMLSLTGRIISFLAVSIGMLFFLIRCLYPEFKNKRI